MIGGDVSYLVGVLGATYDDRLRLTGKSVGLVDFLILLIELFFARYYG